VPGPEYYYGFIHDLLVICHGSELNNNFNPESLWSYYYFYAP